MDAAAIWGGATLIGLLPAWIAHRKGRSFFAFWLFGTLIFIIALPFALLMKPNYRVLAEREAEAAAERAKATAELAVERAIHP